MLSRAINKFKICVSIDEIYIFGLLLAILFVLVSFPGN